MRVINHPVLGGFTAKQPVIIEVDGEVMTAYEGDTIAAALMAAGRLTLRHTYKRREPRGVFCGIGRCTDCVMTVDGQANVRTCVTPVRPGMRISTQGQTSGQGGDLCEPLK
ncbi:(2Fe-2S)-binding protein [Sporomusa sp.]|uniref:(2Fe-2S)-binding protein n=1 Tax=Sporomusa sp. TaxID=2078658 RepID=UPI002BFB8871|nr:(2Fe-2S)-binding protein [Sporomusa sp.]HWR44732.1 (2Fe-2S)-binding protein [Sporomusa sp.]